MVKKRGAPIVCAGKDRGLTARLVKLRLWRVGTTGRLPLTRLAPRSVAGLTGCGCSGALVVPNCVAGMVVTAWRTWILPCTA